MDAGVSERPGAPTLPESAACPFAECYGLALGEIRQALEAVDPAQVEALVDALLEAEQVFVIGVGRVMLSLQAFAKRLNHLGVRTFCVGDIDEPAITERDLLVVGSGSGESAVPVAIARIADRHGARIAHIGSNPHSSLAPLTDVLVRIPVRTKLQLPDEIASAQIMSSLFEQSLYVLGDAVALMIVRRRQLVMHDLWRYHANLE
jgi:6-phospho-3-hexuloisomerase